MLNLSTNSLSSPKKSMSRGTRVPFIQNPEIASLGNWNSIPSRSPNSSTPIRPCLRSAESSATATSSSIVPDRDRGGFPTSKVALVGLTGRRVGSPDDVVEAVVVVEGVVDVEAGSDVEVDWLVAVDLLAAEGDDVDASLAAPGGEQATMSNRPTTLSRIEIPSES